MVMQIYYISFKQALGLLQVCLCTPQIPITPSESPVHHILITYKPAFTFT